MVTSSHQETRKVAAHAVNQTREEDPRKLQTGKQVTQQLTSIGFSHPHPRIQTLWIPWPGPGSRVACRSLTTLQSTKKMRNHRFDQGKDITVRNKSAEEEGAYQR
jgi:hypothetical protein